MRSLISIPIDRVARRQPNMISHARIALRRNAALLLSPVNHVACHATPCGSCIAAVDRSRLFLLIQSACETCAGPFGLLSSRSSKRSVGQGDARPSLNGFFRTGVIVDTLCDSVCIAKIKFSDVAVQVLLARNACKTPRMPLLKIE